MKNLVLEVNESNWSMMISGDIENTNWKIYDDLTVEVTKKYIGTTKDVVKNYTINMEDYMRLIDSVDIAKSEDKKVNAIDGTVWNITEYDKGNIIWKRELGYIYGIKSLEDMSNMLIRYDYIGGVMNIEYDNKIELKDYQKLIQVAGWKMLSDKQQINSLQNSMFISCCKINGEVIGMARVVGDFSVHGLLCDVVVLPEYRHKGIGVKLLDILKSNIYDMLEENEQFLLELLPVTGKREFYLKGGFKYKPENMDGMYLWIKK